jgi:quinol monooxygenase YgiN
VHARVSVVTADPANLGAVVDYVNEVRPSIEDEVGCTGMSLQADADVGLAVVMSFWVSGDAMHESEPRVAPRREEVLERGAATMSVERYRLADFVRSHPATGGAGVRLTRLETEPANLEAAVTAYEDLVLPWLTEADGFCSAMLLVDRRTGRGLEQNVWRDAAALADSRGPAAVARADAVAAADVAVRSLEEHRLYFSTVVPED